MGLVDRQNKIIYWDEVHWQWLPYVRKTRIIIDKYNIPFSIDNYQKIIKETHNYTLKPINEINCAELGKDEILNLSSGNIIKYRNGPTKIIKYNGASYVGAKDLYKSSKIKRASFSVFCTRISKNWPIEKALATPNKKALITPVRRAIVSDHLGNTYRSKTEMAKAYGLKRSTLIARLQKGWPLKKALTTPLLTSTQDHLGNTFKTETEMAKAYEIPRAVLKSRLHEYGWPLEKSLTTPVKSTAVKDHLGNVYQSKTEMAKAYGITRAVLNQRLNKLNWPLEKALTTPNINNEIANTQVKDHLGNIYKSQAQMARAYGIRPSTFKHRKQRGWSLERALTTPMPNPYANSRAQFYTKHDTTDHLENEYSSITQMVNHYKISRTLFCSRIKRGWSLERALTTPPRKESEKK